MSSAASALRFRLMVITTVGVVAALGSFWLLEVMRKQVDHSTPATVRSEPDYHVEKFNFIRMSSTGQAQYLLSGDQLTHNPQDDSVDIQLPVAQSLSPGQAPMTVRGNHARVNQNSNQVQLDGDVNATRPATDKSDPLRLKTETLLLLTDDNVMKTSDPVEIVVGSSVLHGVGMVANNATGVFSMAGRVHGVYQAPPPGKRAH